MLDGFVTSSDVIHSPVLICSSVIVPGDDPCLVSLLRPLYIQHFVRVVFVRDAVSLEHPQLSCITSERLHVSPVTVHSALWSVVVHHGTNAALLVQPPQLVRAAVVLAVVHDELGAGAGVASSHIQHFAIQLTHDVERSSVGSSRRIVASSGRGISACRWIASRWWIASMWRMMVMRRITSRRWVASRWWITSRWWIASRIVSHVGECALGC